MYALLTLALLAAAQAVPVEEQAPLAQVRASGSNPIGVNEDTSCHHYPHSSTHGHTAHFYHGTTPLSLRKRAVVEVGTLVPLHRVLIFRNMVFEWGVGADNFEDKIAWEGYRVPSDCSVSWSHSAAGESGCSLQQAIDFSRGYKTRYGSYDLLSNNCHLYVNRMMNYLDSGCTRYPA
ncbi:PREDICTED: uncharacterized protein LOC109474615 [Branchiostoma belcheri]|uniref:Uncharacterized protein LOC109474615 n=1 Tax=Branchiostoma belcheri TaxID=7741 RepID=A0A6P4ZHF2_BRABE|nr:PREDICTED: uncharacterized protein LOC109474615 [Branchiostoma belcheri]